MESVRDDTAEAPNRRGRETAMSLYQGIFLELEDGNLEGVLYGAILGRIRYNSSLGVSFISKRRMVLKGLDRREQSSLGYDFRATRVDPGWLYFDRDRDQGLVAAEAAQGAGMLWSVER